MQTNDYKRKSLQELKELQEEWLYMDQSEEEADFRQEWVEQGIDIHKALLQKKLSDEDKAIYYRSLAELYLEYGRSEKMIQGNYRTAFTYLQRAARMTPEKGDMFYHLAFLAENMTYGSEKWESAAFYAKEALERGVGIDKQIKIWCLLGKAYLELGFTKDAADCFNQSKKLDLDDDFSHFRTRYSKKSKEHSSFSRLTGMGQRTNKRAEREEWLEKSRQGRCYVLEVRRNGSFLHGNGGSMALTILEADLLKLFFEWDGPLSSQEILDNTAGLGNKSVKSIKSDISRLRSSISKELEVEGKNLIQTIGEGRDQKRYIWNPKIDRYLIN